MYLGSGLAVNVCFALPRLSYPLIRLTVTSLFSCGLISMFIEYLCWHWFNMILDGDCCIGEWIVLTQRPVYIEVSLTGIAGLKSLTVKTGLLLKARHKIGFWGNPVSQSMIA